MDIFEEFKGQNEIEFIKTFSNADTCLGYLSDHKWKNGFRCYNCGSTEEHKCNIAHHKRCKKCLRIISPTANTLFHKVKFGIDKAFYVVFKMSAPTKSISAEQLAKSIGVNRKTALLFQHKVRLAMKSSGQYPMTGQVEVDEAFIGQQEEAIGGGAVDKSQIAVAVKKQGATGIKRVYICKIDNASAGELKVIFDKHISPLAKVLTDKWSGYSPLKELYNITQEKSEPDKNFKVIHRCIQQLKSWLRGIHHSVNPAYLQGYLDEFCYRINRSIHKETIFDNLTLRMVNGGQITKNTIKILYRS